MFSRKSFQSFMSVSHLLLRALAVKKTINRLKFLSSPAAGVSLPAALPDWMQPTMLLPECSLIVDAEFCALASQSLIKNNYSSLHRVAQAKLKTK